MKDKKQRHFAAALFVVMMIASVLAVMPAAQANLGLVTTDLNDPSVTPESLVNTLMGGGITVSNVTYTGANRAAGVFSGGTGIIGFESGIILSSGDIANVIGPNSHTATTTDNGMPGDEDLNSLIPGYTTFDAAVLEFDFVPTSNVIQFRYVFGSEEYNEYVNSPYNNVFGFFVNGNNIALIPGTTTPVSISNVNNGNPCPAGDYPPNANNPAFYIDNGGCDPASATLNTELDGLTVVLTATANVNPGVTNHIKLAIADAGDAILDSDVFIEAASFEAPKLTLTPLIDTNPIGTSHTLTAKLVDATGNPILGETITFTVTDGPHAGATGTDVTDANGEATWSYTGTNEGKDTIVATGAGKTSNEAYKTWEEAPIVLCPDEYRWNTSINPKGYKWDPFPTLFRAWNDVHFVNNGTGDAYNVIATITCAPVNVNIIDGNVTLGDIPAGGSAWSKDFFELEVDMTNPQGPDKGICWRVEYDDAAGVHHVIKNVPKFCGENCSDICP